MTNKKSYWDMNYSERKKLFSDAQKAEHEEDQKRNGVWDLFHGIDPEDAYDRYHGN